jgi:hypothetical protein
MHVTVRKASYDCLVQSAMLLNTQFWQVLSHMLSAPQMKLINGMMKRRQEVATPFF